MTPLTQQFMDRTISPADFGHEEHVRVAFDLLTHYEFLKATVMYVDGIRSIAHQAGAPEKFHMTITLAYLSVIAERITATAPDSVEAFLGSNPALLSKTALSPWYSTGRLNTNLAREQFVLPGSEGALTFS